MNYRSFAMAKRQSLSDDDKKLRKFSLSWEIEKRIIGKWFLSYGNAQLSQISSINTTVKSMTIERPSFRLFCKKLNKMCIEKLEENQCKGGICKKNYFRKQLLCVLLLSGKWFLEISIFSFLHATAPSHFIPLSFSWSFSLFLHQRGCTTYEDVENKAKEWS